MEGDEVTTNASRGWIFSSHFRNEENLRRRSSVDNTSAFQASAGSRMRIRLLSKAQSSACAKIRRRLRVEE